MVIKQKSYGTEVAIGLVVVSAGIMVWSLSRSYAMLQRTEIKLPAVTPTPNMELTIETIDPNQVWIEKMQKFHTNLQETVKYFVSSEPNEYGIVVKHLPTGETVSHGAESQMMAASLYKPIAAAQALQLVEAGSAALNEVLPETDGRTLEQCIKISIEASGNDCGRALLRRTDLASPAGLSALRAMDLKHTDFRGDYPVTTAEDMAIFYEKVYRGDLLSKAFNRLLLDALTNQKIQNRLPQGLPAGTKVAHKTGDLEGAAHDAGLVMVPDNEYVIIIMSGVDSGGRTLAERYDRMAELTGQIHKIMLEAPRRDAAS